jgi:hypothetical protein
MATWIICILTDMLNQYATTGDLSVNTAVSVLNEQYGSWSDCAGWSGSMLAANPLWWFCHGAAHSISGFSVDPCTQNSVIDEKYRSVDYFVKDKNYEHLLCDRTLAKGWYKFAGGKYGNISNRSFHDAVPGLLLWKINGV